MNNIESAVFFIGYLAGAALLFGAIGSVIAVVANAIAQWHEHRSTRNVRIGRR